jgi:hypothetical protein
LAQQSAPSWSVRLAPRRRAPSRVHAAQLGRIDRPRAVGRPRRWEPPGLDGAGDRRLCAAAGPRRLGHGSLRRRLCRHGAFDGRLLSGRGQRLLRIPARPLERRHPAGDAVQRRLQLVEPDERAEQPAGERIDGSASVAPQILDPAGDIGRSSRPVAGTTVATMGGGRSRFEPGVGLC